MINYSMTAMTHKSQMFTDRHAAEYGAYGTKVGSYVNAQMSILS